MAFSKSDYKRAAKEVLSKPAVQVGARVHYFDQVDRYKIALFMRDYFMAQDKFFDGNAFLIECGFR